MCTLCGGTLVLMGMLGDRRHYCCQACGMWFSKLNKRKKKGS